MGGGDLNNKKSWHPKLQVNQERVWKAEKEAYEERKKLDELKRERDQEREMQELQRLQEEAGGKKRVEKVDWMYATPAAGSGPSAGELEEYLLGKKRVDQFLDKKAKEAGQKESQSSGSQGYMALQNGNSASDLSAKIRQDPMFAIKQQEQAAYQALLKDPTRLRQMRAAAGLDDGKEDKEERRRKKEDRRRKREDKERRRKDDYDGYGHRDERRGRSDRHYRDDGDRYRASGGRNGNDRERYVSRRRDSRSYSPPHHDRRAREADEDRYNGRERRDDRGGRYPRSREPEWRDDRHGQYGRGRDERNGRHTDYETKTNGHSSRQTGSSSFDRDGRSPEVHQAHSNRHHSPYSSSTSRPGRPRSPSPPPRRHRPSPPPSATSRSGFAGPDQRSPPAGVNQAPADSSSNDDDAATRRAAALARMQSNAAQLNTERAAYLSRVSAEENVEAQKDEAQRKEHSKWAKLGGGAAAMEMLQRGSKGSQGEGGSGANGGGGENLADVLKRRGGSGLQKMDG